MSRCWSFLRRYRTTCVASVPGCYVDLSIPYTWTVTADLLTLLILPTLPQISDRRREDPSIIQPNKFGKLNGRRNTHDVGEAVGDVGMCHWKGEGL